MLAQSVLDGYNVSPSYEQELDNRAEPSVGRFVYSPMARLGPESLGQWRVAR